MTGGSPTDDLFTGQKRDIATAGSELYYYGARYYDPQIGRFISADIYVQNYNNPQMLNRYTYCLNNPLRYTDPSGHIIPLLAVAAGIALKVAIGAAIGVASYTATNALVNAYVYREEGWGGFSHWTDGWNGRDAAEAAIIGGASFGISYSNLVKAATQY
jgi:RHS repeat-associated protein